MDECVQSVSTATTEDLLDPMSSPLQAGDLLTATQPLALIADVTALLGAQDDVVHKTAQVLDCVVNGLGASECSVWLSTPQGMFCAARSGSQSTPTHDLAPLFEQEESTTDVLAVRRLAAQGNRLGALVLRIDQGLSPDALAVFGIVAQLLAPELVRAEQHRQFVATLEQRAREIEDARRFTLQIIDSLPVSLYVIDRDYRVQVWNRNRESGAQGVSRDAAIGKTIFEILHRAPAEKLRRDFEEVFTTGRIQQFTMESRAATDPRTYRITKIPMRLMDGEATSHVITIGEDVTDWATAQERIALSEALAGVGERVAGVLHDLSSPLDSLSAAARGLVSPTAGDSAGVPAEVQRASEIILRDADRFRAIVGNLLDVGRPLSTLKSSLDVNRLVEITTGAIQHSHRFRNLRIQRSLEASLPEVYASSEQLSQVLVALLNNAADAMPDGGAITVLTRRGINPANEVVIEVVDDGCGIETAMLPRIFDPFFTTKASEQAPGLGLSICYQILTDHHGRIEVDSAVGAGSTFRILLPAEGQL